MGMSPRVRSCISQPLGTTVLALSSVAPAARALHALCPGASQKRGQGGKDLGRQGPDLCMNFLGRTWPWYLPHTEAGRQPLISSTVSSSPRVCTQRRGSIRPLPLPLSRCQRAVRHADLRYSAVHTLTYKGFFRLLISKETVVPLRLQSHPPTRTAQEPFTRDIIFLR